MGLKSFIAGMLVLFAAETLLPFAGVKVPVAAPNPLARTVVAVAALITAYYLLGRE
jgi:hypothetical protein